MNGFKKEETFSGLRFADGAIPIVPAVAGPKSEMISPNKFEATITSKVEALKQV